MASWFQNFATSAKHFADELADSLMAQANAAQEEIAAEQEKIKREREKAATVSYSLPWEPTDEAHSILTQPLMSQILLLSHHESNFTSPLRGLQTPSPFPDFVFEAYIPLAMELMKYDAQLVHMHSKLSPKLKEERFWFHFYQRCMYLRYKSGMEGPEGVAAVQHIDMDDAVNVVDGPTPSISPVVPASPMTARDTSPVVIEAPPVSDPPAAEPTEEELAAAAEQARIEAEEEQLRAEVEAELAGHADTDYDFSSEFEELGIDDMDDTDDAELEAQIARELMEDT